MSLETNSSFRGTRNMPRSPRPSSPEARRRYIPTPEQVTANAGSYSEYAKVLQAQRQAQQNTRRALEQAERELNDEYEAYTRNPEGHFSSSAQTKRGPTADNDLMDLERQLNAAAWDSGATTNTTRPLESYFEDNDTPEQVSRPRLTLGDIEQDTAPINLVPKQAFEPLPKGDFRHAETESVAIDREYQQELDALRQAELPNAQLADTTQDAKVAELQKNILKTREIEKRAQRAINFLDQQFQARFSVEPNDPSPLERAALTVTNLGYAFFGRKKAQAADKFLKNYVENAITGNGPVDQEALQENIMVASPAILERVREEAIAFYNDATTKLAEYNEQIKDINQQKRLAARTPEEIEADQLRARNRLLAGAAQRNIRLDAMGPRNIPAADIYGRDGVFDSQPEELSERRMRAGFLRAGLDQAEAARLAKEAIEESAKQPTSPKSDLRNYRAALANAQRALERDTQNAPYEIGEDPKRSPRIKRQYAGPWQLPNTTPANDTWELADTPPSLERWSLAAVPPELPFSETTAKRVQSKLLEADAKLGKRRFELLMEHLGAYRNIRRRLEENLVAQAILAEQDPSDNERYQLLLETEIELERLPGSLTPTKGSPAFYELAAAIATALHEDKPAALPRDEVVPPPLQRKSA